MIATAVEWLLKWNTRFIFISSGVTSITCPECSSEFPFLYQHVLLFNLRGFQLCTYETPPRLRVIGLPPGPRPGHKDCIVLHASQPCRLDEVGDPISEVWGHHNMTETLGPLCWHGGLNVLDKALEIDMCGESHKSGNHWFIIIWTQAELYSALLSLIHTEGSKQCPWI